MNSSVFYALAIVTFGFKIYTKISNTHLLVIFSKMSNINETVLVVTRLTFMSIIIHIQVQITVLDFFRTKTLCSRVKFKLLLKEVIHQVYFHNEWQLTEQFNQEIGFFELLTSSKILKVDISHFNSQVHDFATQDGLTLSFGQRTGFKE